MRAVHRHRLLGTIDPVAVHGTGFRVLKEVPKIAKHDDTRINDEITATRCRLIGVDGSQLGLFDMADGGATESHDGTALSKLTDALRDRFGDDAVSYGRDLRFKDHTTGTAPMGKNDA